MTEAARPVALPRLLAGEIAVGTLVNIAFNLFFAWLIFYGRTPIGRDAVMLDTMPAAFLPALLMTFPVTMLMRKRIRDGMVVASMVRLPFALPRALPLRAAAVAVLALALTSLPVTTLLWAGWTGDWSWTAMVLFKIGFSAFHAVVISPIVVMAALSLDRVG